MRLAPRTLAFITVAAGMLVAPVFTRVVARPELPQDSPRGAAGQARLPADLAEGWEARVASRLSRDGGLSIDEVEVRSVLRIAQASASRFDVDPLTVLAVIRVESRFDPYAVSSAGAMGLMQVRAETAREIAPRLGIEWTSDDLLFDPDVNVLIGTCYLRSLLDRFGSVEVALAAFHAGPNRIASRDLRLGSSSVDYASRVWSALLALRETARV